jgi:hypothetical protein
VEFFLFLLVNFTLFVRPTDFVQGYEELSVYNYVLLVALVAAAPKIVNHCVSGRLFHDPIVVCVLGLVPAIALSHLCRLDTYSARTGALEFCKVVIYYLMLISVVNSTQRLRIFLYAVALFAVVTSAIALLNYFDVVEVTALRIMQESHADAETGEISRIPRLCATGVFNDPNDLAMVSVFSMVICAMGLADNRQGLLRIVWLVPLAVLFVTLFQTKSRGGLLAFVCAAGALSYFRFGLLKSACVGLLAVPALAFAIVNRQADLSGAMSRGTGHSRIQLWAEGLIAMRQSPFFGIGSSTYADQCGQVAHNSFINSFVELGLFGGALFLGAFWFSGLSLWKLGRGQSSPLLLFTSDSFRKMQPFLLAGVVGFFVSQLSISRAYVIPTYIVIGAANVYSLELQRQGLPPVLDWNLRRIGQLLLLSALYLGAVYTFIRVGFR